MNFFEGAYQPEQPFHFLAPHVSQLPMSRTCSGCGQTLAALQQGPGTNCERCYTTFADVLLPIIRGMHRAIHHRGKSPKLRRDTLQQALKKLQEDLTHAIEHQRFEDAAFLRDRIELIKGDLDDPES